ncbi:hypothetical protein [Pontibacter ruber]|uniref:Lipocalin-like domain-containing protein n=1 Tax=Pontibacter ruber TaxID=1343895 RepID=A0ABW5CYM8_9BACT|nr:hypothetical protein [Pontibacter ruber]
MENKRHELQARAIGERNWLFLLYLFMQSLNSLRLFLVLLLLAFSSCDGEDDKEYETKKGFLTAHTWKYERVSINGSANRVNSFPDDRFKFNMDGSYIKTTTDLDGNISKYDGNWELNSDATQLTFIQGTMRFTAPIRELSAKYLKITRNDAPEILIEFDFIPE